MRIPTQPEALAEALYLPERNHMNPEIKNRFTGSIIIKAWKYADVRKAVEENRADLQGAILRDADLRGANLQGADLQGAILQGAYLQGANLTVIFSKYACHLSWSSSGERCIRIGCECRPVAEYEQMAEELATKHDRIWWDSDGKYIFEFLVAEADRRSRIQYDPI